MKKVGICFGDKSRIVLDPNEEFVQYYKDQYAQLGFVSLKEMANVKKAIEAKISLVKNFVKHSKSRPNYFVTRRECWESRMSPFTTCRLSFKRMERSFTGSATKTYWSILMTGWNWSSFRARKKCVCPAIWRRSASCTTRTTFLERALRLKNWWNIKRRRNC